MTARKLTLSFLLAALTVVSAYSQSYFNGSGYLQSPDGTITKFQKFSIRFQGEGYTLRMPVQRTKDSPVLPVQVQDVASITLIKKATANPNYPWWLGAVVHIKLRNGQEGDFILADGVENFKVVSFDSFTKTTSVLGVGTSKVVRVVFGKDFGNAKENPRTGQIFPSSYQFDPFTGEKLRWIETKSSLHFSPGEHPKVVKNVVAMATSVRVPGFYSVEPATASGSTGTKGNDITDSTIGYVKTVVDPLSSAKDQLNALIRLKDAVLKN